MPAPGLSTSMLSASRPHSPPLSGSALVRIAIATSTIGSSTTSLRPLSSRSACLHRVVQRRPAEQAAQQHRIGRGERRAEDRGQRHRQIEHVPRGAGDQDGGQQRAGAEHEAGEQLVCADFREIERDAVGEQHEHQRQRGHDPQHLGLDAGIEQAEHARPDQESHGQEDRDLRHAGAIDPPGQQRRHHDDGADERQHREEGFHQIIQPRPRRLARRDDRHDCASAGHGVCCPACHDIPIDRQHLCIRWCSPLDARRSSGPPRLSPHRRR